MILVDSSVWIDHLSLGISELEECLESLEVIIHPFVIGELACGNLKNRREILNLLHSLPTASRVSDDEVLYFIERHSLSGKGLGLIDMHLLAAAYVESCDLWTLDKKLNAAAKSLQRVGK